MRNTVDVNSADCVFEHAVSLLKLSEKIMNKTDGEGTGWVFVTVVRRFN